jgi:hypothetical protein
MYAVQRNPRMKDEGNKFLGGVLPFILHPSSFLITGA